MKKIISLFLVFVVLMSFASVAEAATLPEEYCVDVIEDNLGNYGVQLLESVSEPEDSTSVGEAWGIALLVFACIIVGIIFIILFIIIIIVCDIICMLPYVVVALIVLLFIKVLRGKKE